jgi:hypothetical protein
MIKLVEMPLIDDQEVPVCYRALRWVLRTHPQLLPPVAAVVRQKLHGAGR